MLGNLQLWLAGPQARQHFDPARLTNDEQARYARLRRPERRQEFEVSRALRTHIRGEASQPASESLSHSGGYAAVARAHPSLRVGVDLEAHQARDELATARNVFSESEVHALSAVPARERAPLFYAMWTVKEALAKALQLPLLEALRSCVLVVEGPQWQIRAPTPVAGRVAVYQPRIELTLAVACIGESLPIESWSWPPQQPATWPLIAAIALAASDAPAATGPGSAGAARDAAPA